MNYLKLCQVTRQECRDIAGEGPTTVIDQKGDLKRIVDWVSQSYNEIQNRHLDPPWRWLRHGFSFNTVANDDSYTFSDCTDTTDSAVITRFSSWYLRDYEDPPRIYLTSAGSDTQTWLTFIEWESFKWLYRMGAQSPGFPAHISIDPQDNLVLGPKPNGIYTITGDYIRSAQELANNGDVPEMPAQYHYLIVYEAMVRYGYAEAAQEVLMRGEKYAKKLMRQLEINQLTEIRNSGPLA